MENVADYVRYDIAPPVELMAEYNRLKKENILAKEERVNDLLEDAAATVSELKKWWAKDFKSSTKKQYPTPVIRGIATTAPIAPPPVRESEMSNIVNAEATADGNLQDSKLEEVVVIGYGTQKQKSITAAITTVKNINAVNIPDIKIPEFKSDKDYIKKLEGVKKKMPMLLIYN
ncbi:hypothetical protein [Niabella ginsengisoli]|uniref:Uncharacterized protein n=1 Tax=Niabella ginsengisoli TaxID=522298 RepID=A0ABS9SRB9_9BACT|nr:hypothetical protein [Niabella ginsengisoli]MCH5600771.1 hypothetical protein [Niabella ginsengisoli]